MKPFIALTALQHESIDPDEGNVLPRVLPLAGHDSSLPRLAAARPRQHGSARGDRAARATCTSISSRSRSASTTIAAGLKEIRLRCARGARHQRRESRCRAVAANGRRRQFARREDQVWFPGETVDHRHRPGLHARDAGAARARRRDVRGTRHALRAAALDRHRERRHARGQYSEPSRLPSRRPGTGSRRTGKSCTMRWSA